MTGEKCSKMFFFGGEGTMYLVACYVASEMMKPLQIGCKAALHS